MKNIIFIILTILLIGCREKETTVAKYSVDQFMKNISVSGNSFSPDESKLLISSNESGIWNAWEIDIASGHKKQLTHSITESYTAISYFPNDNRFLFLFDEGGNENLKISVMSEDGQARVLTPGDGIRNEPFGWSRDEQYMYLLSNKRDPNYGDIYKLSIESVDDEILECERIYQNNDGLDVGAISPNERYFAIVQTITNADGKMYLYDNETGKKTDISKHEGDAIYAPQFFSLDNKTLYYNTDANSDFVYLAKRDLETGKVEKVYHTNWDVWFAHDSWNEKYRVIGVNKDAKINVLIINNLNGKEVKLPEIPGGSISAVDFSKSESLACLRVSTSASPSNIYVYNFETGELKRLTNALNPEIDPADLVHGQVVRYKSLDGLEIPAIYYQPKQATTRNQVPALVFVHGGPGSQSTLRYSPLIQYLVNYGYAILAVNHRGSSGYGKEFKHMDDKKHGDKNLKDCIAGKDFLASTGVIDMNKIGIIGGSYGGYMVMAALTFEPEAFDVGVNMFGVTNWLRTLKSMPPFMTSYRKMFYEEIGDPETLDSISLYEISPLFHAQNVTKPVIVIQGANDVRVLRAESDEIVEAVRANGVPVEYIVFDDEGHGFLKQDNRIEAYGKIKVFLDRYLKGISE